MPAKAASDHWAAPQFMPSSIAIRCSWGGVAFVGNFGNWKGFASGRRAFSFALAMLCWMIDETSSVE
jgi:uncharacterized membrane protein